MLLVLRLLIIEAGNGRSRPSIIWTLLWTLMFTAFYRWIGCVQSSELVWMIWQNSSLSELGLNKLEQLWWLALSLLVLRNRSWMPSIKVPSLQFHPHGRLVNLLMVKDRCSESIVHCCVSLSRNAPFFVSYFGRIMSWQTSYYYSFDYSDVQNWSAFLFSIFF